MHFQNSIYKYRLQKKNAKNKTCKIQHKFELCMNKQLDFYLLNIRINQVNIDLYTIANI